MRQPLILVHAAICLAAVGAACFILADAASAQNRSSTANLSGQVTANQREVRAFRVKARDVAHRISFMVYTENGRYHLYNLPSSLYEVQVIEPGFESPIQKIELKAGANSTLDLALKSKSLTSDVQLVDYDEAYPPGPGREALQRSCTGCHGKVAWLRYGPHTEDEWRRHGRHDV